MNQNSDKLEVLDFKNVITKDQIGWMISLRKGGEDNIIQHFISRKEIEHFTESNRSGTMYSRKGGIEIEYESEISFNKYWFNVYENDGEIEIFEEYLQTLKEEPQDTGKQLSQEEENKRQMCLKRVEDAYQDINSPHFRRNERYSWAVASINKKFMKTISNKKNLNDQIN